MAKGTKLNERAVTILFAKMDRLRSSEWALHEWALLGINIHSGRSVVQSHPGHGWLSSFSQFSKHRASQLELTPFMQFPREGVKCVAEVGIYIRDIPSVASAGNSTANDNPICWDLFILVTFFWQLYKVVITPASGHMYSC